MVSISVTFENGACKWKRGSKPAVLECRQTKPCTPTVMRTWSGVPPNSTLDFCFKIGETDFCLDPKPSSGSGGQGSDSRDSLPMACDGMPREFSVNSPECGLSASVEGTCSECNAI